MNTQWYLVSFFFLYLLIGCKNNAENSTNPGTVSSNMYTFQIAMVAVNPKVNLPTDSIPASRYQADTGRRSYSVRFSRGLDSVFIQNDSIIGIKYLDTLNFRKYNITNLFAGGRFIVWTNTQPQTAEYTVYGSGVPIIKSERGTMISAQ